MLCTRILSALDPGNKLVGIMVLPMGLTLRGSGYAELRKNG